MNWLIVVCLRAENSKTRKRETMPLEAELLDIVERRRAAAILKDENGASRFAEYVFHREGEPVGDFRKAWASACRKANVSHRLFHDLRRTASRNMLDAGVPQAVAMQITGHRTDSMFRRYAIVNEEQKESARQNAAVPHRFCESQDCCNRMTVKGDSMRFKAGKYI